MLHAAGLVSLDEFIDLARAHMRETRCTASQVVDVLRPTVYLTSAARLSAERVGLVFLVGDAEHKARQQILRNGPEAANESETRNGSGEGGGADRLAVSDPPCGSAPVNYNLGTWSLLEKLQFVGADGRFKPLAQFTGADCAAFKLSSLAQVQSYTARARWADHAEGLLQQHQVIQIADLPPTERHMLADEASAW